MPHFVDDYSETWCLKVSRGLASALHAGGMGVSPAPRGPLSTEPGVALQYWWCDLKAKQKLGFNSSSKLFKLILNNFSLIEAPAKETCPLEVEQRKTIIFLFYYGPLNACSETACVKMKVHFT